MLHVSGCARKSNRTTYFVAMSGMLSHNVFVNLFFCSVILIRLYMRHGFIFQEPFTSVERNGVILMGVVHVKCIKEKDLYFAWFKKKFHWGGGPFDWKCKVWKFAFGTLPISPLKRNWNFIAKLMFYLKKVFDFSSQEGVWFFLWNAAVFLWRTLFFSKTLVPHKFGK